MGRGSMACSAGMVCYGFVRVLICSVFLGWGVEGGGGVVRFGFKGGECGRGGSVGEGENGERVWEGGGCEKRDGWDAAEACYLKTQAITNKALEPDDPMHTTIKNTLENRENQHRCVHCGLGSVCEE